MNSPSPSPSPSSFRPALSAQSAGPAESALHRLADYMDDEIGSLEDLFELVGNADAIEEIIALLQTHLDGASTPGDIRRLLQDARASLARLLEEVRAIPADAGCIGSTQHDFDAWCRWSGARLEDIVRTLSCALDR